MLKSPAMAGSTVPLTEKFSKQACDNCRRRKIKCNRAYPSCDKCDRLLLSCSYKDVLQRKGPKFRTVYPKAPLHPLAARVSMTTGEPASSMAPQAQCAYIGSCSVSDCLQMAWDTRASSTLRRLRPPRRRRFAHNHLPSPSSCSRSRIPINGLVRFPDGCRH